MINVIENQFTGITLFCTVCCVSFYNEKNNSNSYYTLVCYNCKHKMENYATMINYNTNIWRYRMSKHAHEYT